MGPDVAKEWVQLSHENGVVSTVIILNTSWSHIHWRKFAHRPTLTDVSFAPTSED
jgi:hypothetical protein